MKVLLFGASGMVGDGVLHACLGDPRVTEVLAIGRSALGIAHGKLRELHRTDFFQYDDLRAELASTDACFFCLGVSAAGLREADYTRQTFDLTLAAARALSRVRPGATFCYVSGAGTDSSERGRAMWARVKGRTENALLALPLNAYMFRPGFIRPRPGKASRTALYRVIYAVIGPLYPVLKRIAPAHVTATEIVGKAMITCAVDGYPHRVLEARDINTAGGAA